MRGHIREQEWIDLVAGHGSEAERGHLAACAECRGMHEELRATWETARAVDVPEPSPLDWDAFRRRLGRRIAEEWAPSVWDRMRAGFRQNRWAPLAAAGVVVVALLSPLVVTVHRTPAIAPGASQPAIAAWSPVATSEEEDGGLTVLWEMDSGEDLTGAVSSDLHADLLDMSDEEDGIVAEQLRAQMKGRSL